MLDLGHYHIILASQSPRRRELLRQLGIDFELKTIDGLEEHYPSSLAGEEIAEYLAKQKADAFRQFLTPDSLIITADTIVWAESQMLGKPKDAADAKVMLQLLSGKTHKVYTGVVVTTAERQDSFTAETDVTFATLADDEIDFYIERYRPFDKAGAYGIQEWIGYVGVEKIDGSFFNVMGLPIQRLYRLLKRYSR